MRFLGLGLEISGCRPFGSWIMKIFHEFIAMENSVGFHVFPVGKGGFPIVNVRLPKIYK